MSGATAKSSRRGSLIPPNDVVLETERVVKSVFERVVERVVVVRRVLGGSTEVDRVVGLLVAEGLVLGGDVVVRVVVAAVVVVVGLSTEASVQQLTPIVFSSRHWSS